eukprot:scaffold18115_cov112-Isochrysis_galbana.AAC.1
MRASEQRAASSTRGTEISARGHRVQGLRHSSGREEQSHRQSQDVQSDGAGRRQLPVDKTYTEITSRCAQKQRRCYTSSKCGRIRVRSGVDDRATQRCGAIVRMARPGWPVVKTPGRQFYLVLGRLLLEERLVDVRDDTATGDGCLRDA